MITRRAAALELALFLAIVYSFIWIWREAPGAVTILYVSGLGLTIGTHILHRESPRRIGFRLDNLMPALRDAAVVVLPVVAVLLAVGWAGGYWSREALSADRFRDLAGWAFLQQYLLQGFIHRRIASILDRGREPAVALIFALLHLPNPVLVPVTFAAGYVFAVLFRRQPNLWVLALCHAVGSTAVAFAFDPSVLRNMRVGPGYWR